MRNSKSSCIFEYSDTVYVVDFDKMTMWLHNEEDDSSPISTLSIYRVKPNDWRYRHASAEDGVAWEKDHDLDFIKLLEDQYENYVNQIIVSKHARPQAGKTQKILSNSLPKLD